jgi:2-polyprenyl-6-methoxyphenol hydroxylase-like FAD-dependent oxidoreductase
MYDVIISGGGPTGVALAIELSFFGVKALVLEKHNQPLELPRAQTLSPRTMEFMARWGVAEQMIKEELLPEGYPVITSWCTALHQGKEVALIPFGTTQDINQFSAFTYHRVPLWITEKCLRSRALQTDTVDLRLQHEVASITQNRNSVTVTARTPDHQLETFEGRFGVGCDGVDSILRQSLHIPYEGKEYNEARQIVFHSRQLRNLITVSRAVLYLILGEGSYVGLGTIDGKDYWYAQLMSFEEKDPTDEQIEQFLFKVVNAEFDITIQNNSAWMLQTKIARHFQDRRVFLIGDAAHSWPPQGAHGLNTCLGDVVNLGWKLAAVINGLGDTNLLKSYEKERKPIALRNAQVSTNNFLREHQVATEHQSATIESTRTGESTLVENLRRMGYLHFHAIGVDLGYSYDDSPICIRDALTVDAPDTFDHYEPCFSPGHPVPDLKLDSSTWLYDKLSRGFTILNFTGVSALNSFDADVFRNADFPMTESLIDRTQIKKLAGANFVLVRPDWHVCWRGMSVPKDINGIFDIVLGETLVVCLC